MIRFIIFLIYAILVILFSIPALLVGAVWGKFNKESRNAASRRFVQWVFKTVCFICGTKTTVIGIENLPPADEAVLYIGNHRSFFDILISYPYLNGPCGYVAKKELQKIPVLKHWMDNIYCLFLDRKDPKEGMKMILSAIDQVKSGVSVFIFPEGTRNKGEGIQDFKEGSFKIAQKSGCRIIPVVQNNTNALFEDHFPLFKKAHTIIEFGKPIDISELSPEDKKHVGAYTHSIMLEIYEKNQALL